MEAQAICLTCCTSFTQHADSDKFQEVSCTAIKLNQEAKHLELETLNLFKYLQMKEAWLKKSVVGIVLS